MLSIGKLTHLAQMQEDATVDESMLDGMCIAIDSKSTDQILMTCYRIAFHDGLDFVSVHEALTEELKSAVASVPGKQSLDRQVETILQKKASTVTDKKVYPLVCLLIPIPKGTVLIILQIFKQLVRSLFQGKALSVEDIADVLSLKDNDTTISDYATALHLLARADVSPPLNRLIDP
jgi:nuclear pore complex protein Nup133